MEIENTKIGETLRTDTESIKLYKNTKNYNWEIKILGTDIERLREINENMKVIFDLEVE